MRCANMNISLLEEVHHISNKDPTTSDHYSGSIGSISQQAILIGSLAVMHSLGYLNGLSQQKLSHILRTLFSLFSSQTIHMIREMI